MRPELLLLLAASCVPAASPSPSPSSPAPSDSASPASAPSSSASPVASTAPPSPTDSAPPPGPVLGPVPIGGAILLGDINAPPHFDPRPTLVTLEPKLLDCFNQARASHPSLHGKLMLRVQISEAGAALSAEADPSGSAYDPALVKCIDGVMKSGVKFPRPGGVATVAAPLVFRP